MFDVVYPYINDIREMLDLDNLKDNIHFSDLDWRLSMVTSTRSRHNMMVPKYTIKMDLQKAQSAKDDLKNNQSSSNDIESIIFDSDYNNLKRLQNEMEDALKSLNTRYPKKVIKFIK